MKALLKNGKFRIDRGKITAGESCADIDCRCCPGPAIKLTISGVVTTEGREDLQCASIAINGEFENGEFHLPRVDSVRYFPRGVSAVYPNHPISATCAFAASRINDYAPLKASLLFNVEDELGYCDGDPETRTAGFRACWNSAFSLIAREGTNDDGVPLYRVQILIDTSWYVLAPGGNDIGVIFEAVFAWDGATPISGIPNLIGTGPGEVYFGGGEAAIELVDDTTPLFPGAASDVCAPMVYIVEPIYAAVECGDDGWTKTTYYAGSEFEGRQFPAPDCVMGESIAHAILSRYPTDATFFNTGWRPAAPTGSSHGGELYVYWLGYCVDPEATPDASYDEIYNRFKGIITYEYPGGLGNTVESMPSFDVFGYAPHHCGETSHWLYRFGVAGQCETGEAGPVGLLSAICTPFVPESPDEWNDVGPPDPRQPWRAFEQWIEGGPCVFGDIAPTIAPPDAPDEDAINEACGKECKPCGDCEFAVGSTADLESTYDGDDGYSHRVGTLTLNPDAPCQFSGSTTFTVNGVTTTEEWTIIYDSGLWYPTSINAVPGDCTGCDGTDSPDSPFSASVAVHGNACNPVDIP